MSTRARIKKVRERGTKKRKKRNNNTLNCDVYSSFQVIYSDHRFVSAKMFLFLPRNKKETSKASGYDWSLFHKKWNRQSILPNYMKKNYPFQGTFERHTLNMNIFISYVKQQPGAYQPNQETNSEYTASQLQIRKKNEITKKN